LFLQISDHQTEFGSSDVEFQESNIDGTDKSPDSPFFGITKAPNRAATVRERFP
jgi:hypothetical protein